MRRLDCGFLEDLKDGCLSGLREMVVSDPSLCLELRGSAIHVYYRGGRLMAVERKRDGFFGFDSDYLKGDKGVDLDPNDICAWLSAVPKLKHTIDLHLGTQAKDEREFQQVLLRENNFGRIAQSTDYYVCDIEYAASGYGRFDLVAVHWPTTKRQQTTDRRLVFIEMKYGDTALGGKSGIGAHIEAVNCFLDTGRVTSFKDDMKEVFNQKRRLGLMRCDKCLTSFSDEPPIFLLVFANHQPRSSTLAGELRGLPTSNSRVEVRVATASFMGYGLYDQATHTLKEAQTRFSDYIHSPR